MKEIRKNQTYTNDGAKRTPRTTYNRQTIRAPYKTQSNRSEGPRISVTQQSKPVPKMNVSQQTKRIYRPIAQTSQNQTLVNDGGGFSSQRDAQDRAYSDIYRNMLRKKTNTRSTTK